MTLTESFKLRKSSHLRLDLRKHLGGRTVGQCLSSSSKPSFLRSHAQAAYRSRLAVDRSQVGRAETGRGKSWQPFSMPGIQLRLILGPSLRTTLLPASGWSSQGALALPSDFQGACGILLWAPLPHPEAPNTNCTGAQLERHVNQRSG